MTVAEQLAREALELTFEQLPPEVVHEAKLRVLDTLACAMGGFDSPPSDVIQNLVRELGGPPEATVIGSGLRTSAMNAALANGVMVRFTEAMDISSTTGEGLIWQGHPGEVIPGILAVGERQHSSGKDVITAIVLGYQLLNRMAEAMGGATTVTRWGWRHEIRVGLVGPLVAGKLLALSERQLIDAVGISGAYTAELGIMDDASEQETMSRNLRFPYATYKAILAGLMAQRGLQGPARLFEGHQGFAESMCNGNIDLKRLTRRDDDFTILHTSTKMYPVNGRLPGQIEALVKLVTEHNLRPEDVAHIKITTTPRVVERMCHPDTHRYPQTKETADHSAYYVAALAVVDRAVHWNLDQFSASRLGDPVLRGVTDTMEFVAVPEWGDQHAPTRVDLTTTSGATYTCQVDFPKGHIKNRVSRDDLRHKFKGMAGRFIDEAQMMSIFQTIDELDQLDDVGHLSAKLAFRGGR